MFTTPGYHERGNPFRVLGKRTTQFTYDAARLEDVAQRCDDLAKKLDQENQEEYAAESLRESADAYRLAALDHDTDGALLAICGPTGIARALETLGAHRRIDTILFPLVKECYDIVWTTIDRPFETSWKC